MKTISKAIHDALSYVWRKGKITSDQRGLLSRMMEEDISAKLSRPERLLEIDSAFLRGESSWDESIEDKREIGCYEHVTNPRGGTSALRPLVEKRILIEKKDGVALHEPGHLITSRIMNMEERKPAGFKDMRFVGKIAAFLERQVGNVITELPDREAMMDEAAWHVTGEEALIFSGTPGIFNPLEDEEDFCNHTHTFCESLKLVARPVLHVWNEQSVLAQIRADIKSSGVGLEELEKRYYDHFLPYVCNARLFIRVGDIKKYTGRNWSVPYVSKAHLITGRREAGRVASGKLIYRSTLRNIFSKVGLGVPFKIFEMFPEILDVQGLRSSIIHNRSDFLALDDNRPETVKSFVHSLFDRV